MEYMSLGRFIEYGTPAILLVLVCVNVAQSVLISLLWTTVRDMKNRIVWKDACGPTHEEVNRRLGRLELTANGKSGG